MKPLVVDVPGLPPRELGPNASRRVPAGMRNRLKHELAATWMYATAAALAGREPPAAFAGTGPLRVAITVYRAKGGKKHDDDNFLASAKHGLDALAAVLAVNDSRFRFAPLVWERDPEGGGKVVVEISAEEEPA